jgi:hypothetical protein
LQNWTRCLGAFGLLLARLPLIEQFLDFFLVLAAPLCPRNLHSSSDASQASLPREKPNSRQPVKSISKESKSSIDQQKTAHSASSKQPAAAEESFYTGRGVQPRKTIDGLPVFSLAEMVTIDPSTFLFDNFRVLGHQPGLGRHCSVPVRLRLLPLASTK